MRARIMSAALVVSLGLLSSGALAAQTAPRRIARGWALAPTGLVKIHNYVGRVRVIGWARDSVDVSGTVASHLEFMGGGTRDAIKLGPDGGQRDARDAADLVVRVPAGATLSVRGAATDIDVEGLVNSVDVSTVSGRIGVRGGAQSITVESMDGAVTVTGSPTVLRGRTASGPFTFDGTSVDLSVRTVSGVIDVRNGPIGSARLESIAGSVRVDATLQREGTVTIETHGGDIDVAVPKAQLSRVNARSFRGTARLRAK